MGSVDELQKLTGHKVLAATTSLCSAVVFCCGCTHTFIEKRHVPWLLTANMMPVQLCKRSAVCPLSCAAADPSRHAPQITKI